MLVYALALIPFALVFGRFERGGTGRPITAWRPVLGAALVCAGLALLALDGIAGGGWFGLRVWVLALPFVGAALAGIGVFGRSDTTPQSDRKIETLMEKIAFHHTWEETGLPADVVQQLQTLARKAGQGPGLSALFSGGSGTGKTMAAAIIANELGLDLYRVDFSRVVSKYIGETEKNLALVFEKAGAAKAVLFFDEGDALFGKRTEVRDAHDRYANPEIDNLLQKIEEYEGVVILATNLHRSVDEPFLRRLHCVIQFPGSEEEEGHRL